MHLPHSLATSGNALKILAFVLCASCVVTAALAATPAPRSTGHTVLIHLPNVRLHTEYVVEVNKLGQVVRVTSGKVSRDNRFNLQTYGNAMQMWIRHPNGTADVGLYRVTYDYDPRTHTVRRGVALVKLGGAWGNAEGAAARMVDVARRQAEDAASGKNLPPLDTIIRPTPSPSSTH